jgi:tRNA pseudouridine38-40 synthase
LHSAFELFTREAIDMQMLLEGMHFYLPTDIRVLSIKEVDASFNIIQHPKEKEYNYIFSFGEKNHPFAAPFMFFILEELDIKLMKQGAKLFEGTHNFRAYAAQSNGKNIFEREILSCEISKNEGLNAEFFPPESYRFHVKAKGFLRHQVRLMMGALFELGKGSLSLQDIRESLKGDSPEPVAHMAPATGLILNKVHFN